MYYFRVMCIRGGCHQDLGSEGSTLPYPRLVIHPTAEGAWGPQQGTLCCCQNGVASFLKDGLWEVLPQGTSLTCETEQDALSLILIV